MDDAVHECEFLSMCTCEYASIWEYLHGTQLTIPNYFHKCQLRRTINLWACVEMNDLIPEEEKEAYGWGSNILKGLDVWQRGQGGKGNSTKSRP